MTFGLTTGINTTTKNKRGKSHMMLMVLDFESFYSKTYSLSKMTTEEYINGEEFEVIGMSIKLGDTPTAWYTGTKLELLEILQRFDWNKIALLCHNTFFDGCILSYYFGIVPAKYIDTLSMARAIHGISVGGSLAKLATYYELGVKGTEIVNALGKHLDDFTEEELAAYGEYCINDTELTYKLFQCLLPHFNITELSLIDLTIRMGTDLLLEIDAPLMRQHLLEVIATKQALMDRVIVDKSEIISNNKFAKLLEDCGVEIPMKLSPATGKQTYAFAKTDEGLKALLEHPNLMVQTLVAARLGTKSTLEETRTQRYLGIAERMNGKLPVPLSYYGTTTGRWSAGGGQSTNFQNIPRDSTIKKAITAPEGYVIVGADLANIELRVGLWLAGETKALRLLGEGGDLYKDFASMVFNVPYEEVDKAQRFIGKTSILSLLYSVGAGRLNSAIKIGSGTDLGEAEAKRIVDLYRSTYLGIVSLWKECGVAVRAIAEDRKFVFGPDGFFVTEGKRGIRLPSGLYMQYPELAYVLDTKTGEKGYKYKIRNGYDRLYSGKLFNNICQGTARCIMSEAVVRIAKRYPVVLTVHDSIYCVVPEREASTAYDYMVAELTRPPTWMPTIPLGAEGGWGKSLKDAG